MEEFEKLVEQYENLHPKAESPGFWIMQFDIDVITEMLKNSNGRQISTSNITSSFFAIATRVFTVTGTTLT